MASLRSAGSAKNSLAALTIAALTAGSRPCPVIRKKPISRQVASIIPATSSRSGPGRVPVANALTSMIGSVMPAMVDAFPAGHQSGGVLIRDATGPDWPAIWPFLRQIVAAGETYCYDTDLTEERARAIWLLEPPGRTVVAVDPAGTVLGSAKMNPNQQGPGSHIA